MNDDIRKTYSYKMNEIYTSPSENNQSAGIFLISASFPRNGHRIIRRNHIASICMNITEFDSPTIIVFSLSSRFISGNCIIRCRKRFSEEQNVFLTRCFLPAQSSRQTKPDTTPCRCDTFPSHTVWCSSTNPCPL